MTKKQQEAPALTKKNIIKDVALLLSVPIAIFIVVIAIAAVPRLLARPQYDFVYATCRTYDCKFDEQLSVNQAGQLRHREIATPQHSYDEKPQVYLYYYEVKTDTSRPLTVDEAQKLTLDNASRSKDGYAFTRPSGDNSSFLFWSATESSGWYLEKGIAKQPVTIAEFSRYYYSEQDVKLIGWVLDEK